MANFQLYITLSIISIAQSAFLEFLDPDESDSVIIQAKIIHSNLELWKKCDRICAEKFKSHALSYKSCNRTLSFIIICLYDGGKSVPIIPAGSHYDKELDHDDHHDDHLHVHDREGGGGGSVIDIGTKVLPGEEVPIVSHP